MPAGRPPKMITYLGETLSIADWAQVAKLPKCVLVSRLRSKWSLDDAMLTPVGEKPLSTISAKDLK